MNDRNDRHGIDPDRTEGSMKNMTGSLKETGGSLLGDEKMKREGQADRTEGKLQNAWGGVKDKARELIGTDGRDGEETKS